jgi:hypothetical protein
MHSVRRCVESPAGFSTYDSSKTRVTTCACVALSGDESIWLLTHLTLSRKVIVSGLVLSSSSSL